MKLQIKEMFETTGRDADGKAVRKAIGTLYCESVEGRIAELLAKHGPAFLESLVDSQVLHHPASAAYKAAASKNNPAEGLDRLGFEPNPANQLWRCPLSTLVNRDKEIAEMEAERAALLETETPERDKRIASLESRIHWRQRLPKVERPEGLTDAQIEEIDVVMVNWDFTPGVSMAAANKAAEREAAIQKSVETQLELLTMDGREITPELRAKIETFVRSKF